MADRLEQIFARQLELTRRFQQIEKTNGCLIDDGLPVNLESATGQEQIRAIAWRIVEEIFELERARGIEEERAEAIDVLHFLVEMALTAGVRPEHVYTKEPRDRIPGDMLDQLMHFARKGATNPGPTKCYQGMVQALASGVYELKYRSWKTKPKPTNVRLFEMYLIECFGWFSDLAASLGMTAEDIYERYLGKNDENHHRIDSTKETANG